MFLQRADYSVELAGRSGEGFGEAARETSSRLVKANLPNLEVTLSIVDRIPRTKANKWRPVVTRGPAAGFARMMHDDSIGDPRLRAWPASHRRRRQSSDDSAIVAALERIAVESGLGGRSRPVRPHHPGRREGPRQAEPGPAREPGPWGVEPLVTHASLIRAATSGALRAGASRSSSATPRFRAATSSGCSTGHRPRAWARTLTRERSAVQGRPRLPPHHVRLRRRRPRRERGPAVRRIDSSCSTWGATACSNRSPTIAGRLPRDVLRPAADGEDARARAATSISSRATSSTRTS